MMRRRMRDKLAKNSSKLCPFILHPSSFILSWGEQALSVDP